jgi:hypothetical protein
MSAGDIKGALDVFFALFPRTYQRGPIDSRARSIIVNHERRILDLEKQVAELRALLVGRE